MMTWLARLWGRLQRPRTVDPLLERVDGIQLTATELERVLGVWTRLVKSEGDESDESDEQRAVVGQRVEKELQTYFGQGALQRVQATLGSSGGGNILLAADRLFVAFLGTRAAMAVTRKLYSNLQ
jgi:hypothetical protein